MKKMDLKELEDYLGITDNNNYMGKAKLISDYRLLEEIVQNIKNVEIIRKEDFYINSLDIDNDIIYEYNDLIAYRNKLKINVKTQINI